MSGVSSTTLATASLITAGVGTATSVAGGIVSAQAQRKAGKAQAAIAEQNAERAERNAKEVVAEGNEKERQSRMQHNQLIGQMRAQQGASGIDVGTGSALDATADADMLKEYDTLTIRNDTTRQANNYYQQAADYRTQGSLAASTANNAATGALFGSAASALNGISSVSGSWYKYTHAQDTKK